MDIYSQRVTRVLRLDTSNEDFKNTKKKILYMAYVAYIVLKLLGNRIAIQISSRGVRTIGIASTNRLNHVYPKANS